MAQLEPEERILRAQERLLVAREQESRVRSIELRIYIILGMVVWAAWAVYFQTLGDPVQRWAAAIATVCVGVLGVGLLYEFRGRRDVAAIYSQGGPIIPIMLYAWIFSVEAGFGSYLFIGALGVPALVPESRQRTRFILVGLLILASVVIQVLFTREVAVEPLPIHESTQLATINRAVMSLALFLLALMLTRSSRARRRLDLKELALVETAAKTDALTGLPNRRRVWPVVLEMAESEQPFSMALVDIDHFKAFNDTHGHACGDEALVRVAGVLAEMTRSEDVVGRWGGEEFVVVLPGKESDARVAMDRVREAIAASVDDGGCSGKQITVSVGVARHELGEDPWHTLQRSDRALYDAKRSGRNRVVLDVELHA